jgi:hypothetical protein
MAFALEVKLLGSSARGANQMTRSTSRTIDAPAQSGPAGRVIYSPSERSTFQFLSPQLEVQPMWISIA